MVPFLVEVEFWPTIPFFGDWRLLLQFYDHWVGIYPSSSFTFGGWRIASRLWCGCGASMVVPLVIDAALLTIMPVMGLFPPNDLYFPERYYWVRFLLFVIS